MIIQSQGFFLLRRPLLPIEVLQNFHRTVGDQTEAFERELIHFFAQPSMLEALYVASPELHQSFVELISGHHKGSPEKLLKTLYKYLIRMTSRSTPYGLFAGAAVGTFEDCSRITFPDTQAYTTHARLDMNYVAEMAHDLSRKEAIRRQLRFYPNTSLYRMGDSYRYVEGMLKNKKRHYILSSVEWSPYLEKLLIRARQGVTICQLVEELLSDDISVEEAEAFANQIIDAQLLVSELEATATGDEFFKVLLNKLAAMQDTETEVHQLREIESLLQQQEAGIEKYRKIQRVISQHFVTTGSKDLVQTDLYYHPTHCALSQRFVNRLIKDFQKIVPLAGNNEKTALETFRKKFYEKYEEKEIPLLTAIDNETGIGYGRLTSGKADNLPLLEQLLLPGTDSPETTEWSSLARLRYKIYQDALSTGEVSVQITDAMISDLQQESADQPFLRESFYLFGNLVSPSLEKVDEGEFKFSIHAVSASSGLKLLGRFCHGSPKLTDWVKKALQEEEARHPDAIFAEVAHLPEARVGNVVMRPFLRKYEIPYLAGTTIDPEYQILPDDLMVSVPGGKEIVLRSKRLNKRVFPRLTNAHNYFTGLPFYRFLCELPFQGKNYDYTWSWGFLSDHPFLPRIEYQHLILSRATWNLRKNDFKSLKQKEADGVEELQAIRHRLKMPRYVQVLEGESELLIDFESVFSVQILWDLLRKYDKVRLLEFLGEPQQACVQSQNRHFTHEVIIPFIQSESFAEAAPVRDLQEVAPPVQRNFLMGSKWLYLKIYAGTKTSDRLLTSVIKPLVEEMTEKGLIEKWFFLRFGLCCTNRFGGSLKKRMSQKRVTLGLPHLKNHPPQTHSCQR